MKNKKVFAFDLGGVLLGFDYKIALSRIKDKMEASTDRVIEELYYNEFGSSFEKGLISSEQFYLNFKDNFKASLSYEEFADIWCDIFFAQDEVIGLVEAIRKTHPVFLISNINQLHFDYVFEKFPKVFSLFNDLILSFKVKSVKPEPEIYETLKEVACVEYKDIIYIDDRQDLISAAKKLNLQSIQFISYSQLLRELKELNILV